MARPTDCVTRYRAGASLRVLATSYGVSHQTVKRWLHADGEPLRRRGAQPMAGEMLRTLLRLHQEGHALADIARHLCVRVRVARAALIREGVLLDAE